MFLTPPEIQHQKLKRRLGSYDRDEIDELLENVAASYEQVWQERDAARGRVTELEQQLVHYEELEDLLRDSLLTAQRAAEQVKAEAAKQAQTLIEEARRNAEATVTRAERERDEINSEIARLKAVEQDVQGRCRALLVRALEAIGQQEAAPFAPDGRDGVREAAAPT